MKLHDFGLWFKCWTTPYTWSWSTTIPQDGSHYSIYYDGLFLGHQDKSFDLLVYDDKLLIIKLKNKFQRLVSSSSEWYQIGRHLTIDDFELVENPRYKEY